LEAVTDGPGVHHPLGGLLPGQGRDDGAHGHRRGAVVRRGERRQAPGAAEHHRAPAVLRALHGGGAARPGAAGTPSVDRLPPAPARAADLLPRPRGEPLTRPAARARTRSARPVGGAAPGGAAWTKDNADPVRWPWNPPRRFLWW